MSLFDTRPKVSVLVEQTGERYACATTESLLQGMLRLGRQGDPRRRGGGGRGGAGGGGGGGGGGGAARHVRDPAGGRQVRETLFQKACRICGGRLRILNSSNPHKGDTSWV